MLKRFLSILSALLTISCLSVGVHASGQNLEESEDIFNLERATRELKNQEKEVLSKHRALRNRHINSVILHEAFRTEAEVMQELNGMSNYQVVEPEFKPTRASIYDLLHVADNGDLAAQEEIAQRYLHGYVSNIPVASINWQAWLSKPLADRSTALLGFLVEMVAHEKTSQDTSALERHILRRVHQNEPDAMFVYALCLEQGRLNFVDTTPVVVYYMKSAQMGCLPALYQLARLARLGQGLAEDPLLSIKCHLFLARRGYLLSLCALHKHIKSGFIGERFYEFRQFDITANLKKQAALGGHPIGLYMWAMHLLRMRESAFSGSAYSIDVHDYIHRTGEIVRFLTAAAEQGVAEAQYNLGCEELCKKYGIINEVWARHWLLLAAKQNHKGAKYWYGVSVLTEVQHNITDNTRDLALEYLTEAALSGNTRAQSDLALLYRDGFLYLQRVAFAIDRTESLRWQLSCGHERFYPSLQQNFNHGYRGLDSLLSKVAVGEFKPVEAQELIGYQPNDDSPLSMLGQLMDRLRGDEVTIPRMLVPVCDALSDYTIRLSKVWPSLRRGPLLVTNYSLTENAHGHLAQQRQPRFLHVHMVNRVSYLTIGAANVQEVESILPLLNPVGEFNWAETKETERNIVIEALLKSDPSLDPDMLNRAFFGGRLPAVGSASLRVQPIMSMGQARSCVQYVLCVLENARRRLRQCYKLIEDFYLFNLMTKEVKLSQQKPFVYAMCSLGNLHQRFELLLALLNKTADEFDSLIASPRLRNTSAEITPPYKVIKDAWNMKY